MKVVRFLNESLTHAIISRRAWPRFWVREVAEVKMCDPDKFSTDVWHYTANGHRVDGWFSGTHGMILNAVKREQDRRDDIRREAKARELAEDFAKKNPWKRVQALPEARTVDSGNKHALTTGSGDR